MLQQHSGWVFKKEPDNQTKHSTDRIVALTDGVFAIVMTLLILDIKLPPIQNISNNQELKQYLFYLLPKIESFVFTFLILGIFWMINHLQFQYIKKSDRSLVWINIFYIMFVAFVPFSTYLVGTYYQFKISSIIFGLNILFIGIFMSLNWIYSTSSRRLVDPSLEQRVIDFGIGRNVMLLLSAFLAVILAFFSVHLSFAAYLLYPILQFMYRKEF
jgi:uncharacterized membrane protein